MSKIGKQAISIPQGVEVKIEQNQVKVKGVKGELLLPLISDISLEIKEGMVFVSRKNEKKETGAYHGLFRSLISNMVKGVSEGFSKELEMSGVGYKAKLQNGKLFLSVGYSHSVEFAIPKEIEVKVSEETKIIISGIDKELVGQIAAQIRKIKPCEPYKGKGIKYVGEMVRRKAGKAGKAAVS